MTRRGAGAMLAEAARSGGAGAGGQLDGRRTHWSHCAGPDAGYTCGRDVRAA